MNLDYRINKATFKVKFYYKKKIYSKYHFAEKSKDLLKRKSKNTQIKVGDPKTKIYRDRNDIHSVCKSKNIMSKILIKDV